MAEVRRGGFHRIVLLTVVLMLLVTFSSEADPEDEDCAECHGRFTPPTIVAQGPSEVPVDEPFEVSIVIFNHEARGIHYDLRDIEASISIPDNSSVILASGENGTKTPDNIPRADTGTVMWSLISNETGPAEVEFEMAGIAYYKHDSNSPDEALYRRETTLAFEVKDIGISLTDYSLTAFEGDALSRDITLTTTYNITNVTFTTSSSLIDVVTISSEEPGWSDGFPTIPANGTRTFTITVSSGSPVDGSILVSWDDSHGEMRQINITVSVLDKPEKSEAEIDYLRWAGRISGMIEIPLAAFVIVLGGFPPQVKPWLKKLGRKRITYHCNVSYLILAIALFHLAVLLGGPFAGVLFSTGMVWGFLALAFLITLAINGAAMKPLIKRLGRKYWIRMHQISSIGFVVSMAIHAYMLGTEFAFLR